MNELAQTPQTITNNDYWPEGRGYIEKKLEEREEESNAKEEEEEVKVEEHLESDHFEDANSELSNMRFSAYK